MTLERWEQIQALYLRAVDLRGDEREALLAQASPDVRQEVGAMLAQPTGSKLLDRPVWEAMPESSAPIALGTQLGAYRIETILGEGGMGVVYRALDTKLNRPVASEVPLGRPGGRGQPAKIPARSADRFLAQSSAYSHGARCRGSWTAGSTW